MRNCARIREKTDVLQVYLKRKQVATYIFSIYINVAMAQLITILNKSTTYPALAATIFIQLPLNHCSLLPHESVYDITLYSQLYSMHVRTQDMT